MINMGHKIQNKHLITFRYIKHLIYSKSDYYR